jgi:hypothetical protein
MGSPSLCACDPPRGKSGETAECDVVSFNMLFYIDARMTQLSIPHGRLDRIAMALSGLCLVHCLATAVLLGLVSAAGNALGAPWIHEVGLTLAMILGAVALVRGMREHGFIMPCLVGALGLSIMGVALTMPHDGSEALYTVIGVMILALGHRLNVMAAE